MKKKMVLARLFFFGSCPQGDMLVSSLLKKIQAHWGGRFIGITHCGLQQ